MDNTKTCNDCHKTNLENDLIMCNECGVIKPLSKFRKFTDAYGHLCHDCYSKDWKDSTKLCDKCETYKPVNSFKEFNNGFYKTTCIACTKELWRDYSKDYYEDHRGN